MMKVEYQKLFLKDLKKLKNQQLRSQYNNRIL